MNILFFIIAFCFSPGYSSDFRQEHLPDTLAEMKLMQERNVSARSTLEVSPRSLSWGYSDLSELSLYISTDESWEVSEYGSFIVDQTEGEGSEFIHVRPPGENTEEYERTAVLKVRTSGGAFADVSLRQDCIPASEPVRDEPELLDIQGNWKLERRYVSSSGNIRIEDMEYYDGLGNLSQTVQLMASPDGTGNIIWPMWRDDMLREDAKTYLPYASVAGGSGEIPLEKALSDQASWYGRNGYGGEEKYAYSSHEYEASLLERLTRTRRPGYTYAESGENRPANYEYSSNKAREVRFLVADAEGNLIINGWWPQSSLDKIMAENEDGDELFTYTDGFGRVILERRVSDGVLHDTYRVYDTVGDVLWIVSPEGSSILKDGKCEVPSDDDVNGSFASKWCYVYVRDGRGRILGKKIPGCSWKRYVYDRAGHEVMRQDGLMRSNGQWLCTMRDRFGRVTGTCLIAGTSGRPDYQRIYDSGRIPADVTSSSSSEMSYRVYDGYSGSYPAFIPEPGVAEHADLEHLNGRLTYERLSELSSGGVTGRSVERAYYYDADGRVAQMVERDADGRIGRRSMSYDFSGNMTVEIERHGYDVSVKEYIYNNRGQLIKEANRVNEGSPAEVRYDYDIF